MVALHQITEMLDSVPEYRFIQNGFVQSQLQAGRFLDAPRSIFVSPSGKTTTLQKLGSQPIETPMTRMRCIGYPSAQGFSALNLGISAGVSDLYCR